MDDLSEYPETKILDHGYIQYLDGFGTDASVAEAARVSYDSTAKKNSDEALIRYLMRHKHTSPFEMCELKFKIRMPIFIARQWVRHRTANINEVSARYTQLDRLFYIPRIFSAQSTVNKQSSGNLINEDLNTLIHEKYIKSCAESFDLYEEMMSRGVSREQARMVLPLSTYTTIIWKIDLHNLLHFIALRLPSNAQYEIRAYAIELYKIVQAKFPITAKAFEDYRLKSFTVSKQELVELKKALTDRNIDKPEHASDREFNTLCNTMLSK